MAKRTAGAGAVTVNYTSICAGLLIRFETLKIRQHASFSKQMVLRRFGCQAYL